MCKFSMELIWSRHSIMTLSEDYASHSGIPAIMGVKPQMKRDKHETLNWFCTDHVRESGINNVSHTYRVIIVFFFIPVVTILRDNVTIYITMTRLSV